MHKQRPQLTLGQLIEALKKAADPDQPEKSVMFDFCSVVPTQGGSFKGFIGQFALGHHKGEPPTITALVQHLEEECLAKTFTGYKGGEYQMHECTPVWVANQGECHSTAVVGVRDFDYQVVIETEYREI